MLFFSYNWNNAWIILLWPAINTIKTVVQAIKRLAHFETFLLSIHGGLEVERLLYKLHDSVSVYRD